MNTLALSALILTPVVALAALLIWLNERNPR